MVFKCRAVKVVVCIQKTNYMTLMIFRCRTVATTLVRYRLAANLSMEQVLKLGLMEQNILVNGDMARQTEKGLFSMQTATFLMVISKQIKLTDTVYTSIKLDKDTQGSGPTMFNRALEQRLLRMAAYTKGSFTEAKSTVVAFISGLMVQIITENGAIIKSRAMVYTYGQMAVDTKAHGEKTSFITEVYIRGLMVAAMMESILTTKSMDWASMCGLTAKSTKATGIMENSMGKDGLQTRLVRVV